MTRDLVNNESDDERFEVEKILGKRHRRGGIEFLIKWRGFQSEDNTWEPESHLSGCDNAIKKFYQKQREIRRNVSNIRKSRSNGFNTADHTSTRQSIRSSEEDLSRYRIMHLTTLPPDYSGYGRNEFEEKPRRTVANENTVVVKRRTFIKILAAATLIFVVIFALIQPVNLPLSSVS